MTDPLESVFAAERESVPLLAPPAGQFTRVRARASTRRWGRAFTVTGVVAVLTAGGLVLTRGGAAGEHAAAPAVTRSSAPAAGSVWAIGRPVPAGFAAVSVTFVSVHDGWVLGAAPDHGRRRAVVARTVDGGESWSIAGLPAVNVADRTGYDADGVFVLDAPRVSAIRMVDADEGYLFGPDLWVTRDGGASWQRDGSRDTVADVEAAGRRVWAVASMWLSARSAGASAWTALPGNPVASAKPTTYDITPTPGALFVSSEWGAARSNDGGRTWSPLRLPCNAPAGGVFAALDERRLVQVCGTGRVFWTTDAGLVWHRSGVLAALPEMVAGTTSAWLAADGSGGLLLSSDYGKHWRRVISEPVDYVGFTTGSRVIALGSWGRQLWESHNGGVTWAPYRFGQ